MLPQQPLLFNDFQFFRSRSCPLLLTNLKKCQYCSDLVKQLNMMNETVNKSQNFGVKCKNDKKMIVEGGLNSDIIKEENESTNGIKIEHQGPDDPIAVGKYDIGPLDSETNQNIKMEITEHLEEGINMDNFEPCITEAIISVIAPESESCDNPERKCTFHCPQCAKKFSSQGSLFNHIQSVHVGVRFTCDQCGKQFSSKGILKRHIQSVHECVNFGCDKCYKHFSSQRSLINHVKSAHDGIKFPCNQCNKLFSSRGKLKIHFQAIHEGVKFNCDQCDKQFTQKSNLTSHIKAAHEGVRLNCPQCPKNFSLQSNLRKHIQTEHNGVKFICDKCDKQFKCLHNLNSHIKSVHEGDKLVNLQR